MTMTTETIDTIVQVMFRAGAHLVRQDGVSVSCTGSWENAATAWALKRGIKDAKVSLIGTAKAGRKGDETVYRYRVQGEVRDA